ncbi:MAG: DUF3822 family protein, partial [Bacteroidetes bacterium]|nr:DUF3822 family protein [Bacteroidota bacterium]
MINPDFSIIDSSLANSPNNSNTIVIKVSSVNVTYSVFDTTRNIFVAIESWGLKEQWNFNQIMQALDENQEKIKILKQNFQKVIVIIDSPFFTLIPDELYSPDNAKDYLAFNHTFKHNEKALTDNISNVASKNIYWLPFDLDVFISKYFTNYEYRHISTILLNSVFSETKMQDKVLVNISGNNMLITVTVGKELKYCNTFVFHSAEDSIFYLLNVFTQLKLNPDSFPVLLTGEFDENSAVYNLIYKYIRNISFGSRPSALQYFSGINYIKPHLYFSI